MMTETQFANFRQGARSFFEGLEAHLNQSIPCPAETQEKLAALVKRARSSANKYERRNALHEGAFLYECVFPAVYRFVGDWPNMDPQKAKQALLCEGYIHIPKIASGTPRRWLEHPFSKATGATRTSIMRRWKAGTLVEDSCPDMALRAPFPFKTVFECKYFRQGGPEVGKSALVDGVHEAFFYLGLARLPERGKHAAWDYDFACFLALDASNGGSLIEAWKGVSEDVKSNIWESANIYVMILRGGRKAKSELVRRGAGYQVGTRRANGLPVLAAPDDFPLITSERVRELPDEE